MDDLEISALTHAAQISKYVLNQTIGPDAKNNQDEINNESIQKINTACVNKSPEPQKIITTEQNGSISVVTISDCDKLMERLEIDNCEKNRCKTIKKELTEKQNNLRQESEKRILNNLQSYENRISAIRRNNIETEMSILRDVDNRTESEIVQTERKLQPLLKENQKTIEKLKLEKKRLEFKLYYRYILKYSTKFKDAHERIAKVLLSIEKSQLSNFEDVNTQIKLLVNQYEKLLNKMRNEDIHEEEIGLAQNLVRGIETIEKKLLLDLEKIIIQNQQRLEEENKQLRLQNEKINQEVVKQDLGVPETTPAPPPTQKTSQNTCFEFYNKIMDFYKGKIESVKPLQADTNMKKYRSSCQKAINVPINAISAVNSQHIKDKYDKLYNLLAGAPVKTSDGVINITEHPLGKDFCLLSLAKKFVGQGDSTVSSNIQAAFPIASIIIALWKKFPDFGLLLLAYTFRECPFLVPYFIPQEKGQSTEDYFKTLGYRLKDGVLETQDMYLKRQSGLVRLYAAIMVTEVRQTDGPPHPYSIENGWKWLCNILNLDPLPDIYATLIVEFLQIAAFKFSEIYGVQFIKILQVIQNQYFIKLAQVDSGGPKARLEVFVSKIIQGGTIDKPQGLLSPNFW